MAHAQLQRAIQMMRAGVMAEAETVAGEKKQWAETAQESAVAAAMEMA